MARFTIRGRVLVPVLTGLLVSGGLLFSGTANATEPTAPSASVSSENFDLSELTQAPLARKSGDKGDKCGDKPCVPVAWCEDKKDDHEGDNPKDESAVSTFTGDKTGDEPKGGDKPECFKIPTVHIDDEDCCKSPPGGTIIIKIFNPNKQAVPAQITVKTGDKEHTEEGWVKPGKTTVKLKNLKNGRYYVTVHLYDCVFKGGSKVIRIKCEVVKPTPTSTVTATPTATPTTTAPTTATPTPTETETDSAGTGGSDTDDDQLALTGSSSGIWYTGGTLLSLGVLFIVATLIMRRRRQVQFSAE